MPGMWELPALKIAAVPAKKLLMTVRHAIMQVNYYVRIRPVSEDDVKTMTVAGGERRWVPLTEAGEMALTGLARKVLTRAHLLPTATQEPLLPDAVRRRSSESHWLISPARLAFGVKPLSLRRFNASQPVLYRRSRMSLWPHPPLMRSNQPRIRFLKFPACPRPRAPPPPPSIRKKFAPMFAFSRSTCSKAAAPARAEPSWPPSTLPRSLRWPA